MIRLVFGLLGQIVCLSLSLSIDRFDDCTYVTSALVKRVLFPYCYIHTHTLLVFLGNEKKSDDARTKENELFD